MLIQFGASLQVVGVKQAQSIQFATLELVNDKVSFSGAGDKKPQKPEEKKPPGTNKSTANS